MSRPGVRLVRCPFQQWRSSTPFSSAAADRRWRAQASEPRPESRTRPGARKKEKQENGAHARRTEIRYCDVIENSWRGRITIGVKMVAASFSARLPRGVRRDRRENPRRQDDNLPVQPRPRSENQPNRNRIDRFSKYRYFIAAPASRLPSRSKTVSILKTRPRQVQDSRSVHDDTT